MAACAEVTRLLTSATCWVTSWACWLSEVWRVPGMADSLVSVAGDCAAGIFRVRLTAGRAGPGVLADAWSLETEPPTAVALSGAPLAGAGAAAGWNGGAGGVA